MPVQNGVDKVVVFLFRPFFWISCDEAVVVLVVEKALTKVERVEVRDDNNSRRLAVDDRLAAKENVMITPAAKTKLLLLVAFLVVDDDAVVLVVEVELPQNI